MRWLIRLLLADKRLKIIAVSGASGLLLVLLGLLVPLQWLTKVGMWVGLPVVALSLLGVIGLTGLIIFEDRKRYSS